VFALRPTGLCVSTVVELLLYANIRTEKIQLICVQVIRTGGVQVLVVSWVFTLYSIMSRGHAVAQLVEALRYNPEGRRFDSRCCHWNLSLT
jgi:hypothetical protein